MHGHLQASATLIVPNVDRPQWAAQHLSAIRLLSVRRRTSGTTAIAASIHCRQSVPIDSSLQTLLPLPSLLFLPSLLAGLLKGWQVLPSTVRAARATLLEELVTEQPNTRIIDAAVDVLIDATHRLRFDERHLGGGPCRAVYTRGPQLWRLWTGAAPGSGTGTLLRSGNAAWQCFDPARRGLINAGQVLGDALTVRAEGSYMPVTAAENGKASSRASAVLPQLVRADIHCGELQVLGRRVQLPIR